MLCGSWCSLGTAPGGFCREKLVLLLPGLANWPHGLQLDQRQRGPCARGPARCPAALPPEQAVSSVSRGAPLPTGGPGRRRCGTPMGPNGATRGAQEWGMCWWQWVAVPAWHRALDPRVPGGSAACWKDTAQGWLKLSSPSLTWGHSSPWCPGPTSPPSPPPPTTTLSSPVGWRQDPSAGPFPSRPFHHHHHPPAAAAAVRLPWHCLS